MTICTRSTPGQLYLLHFSAKLGDPANPHGWAQHYLGWALDAEVRIALHLVGQSDVKIVQAALRQGLVITPHILGNAVKGAERAIKRRKQNLARYCPICTACPKPLPAGLFQLALPFDEDDDPDWDFDQVPDPPGLTEWDGYRIAWERRRHAPTCLLPPVVGNIDDLW